ncbi:ATPase-activating ribosome biosynthesis protein [Microbotryomycetes sp. JL221]|nr:ATPase-activating ribosome biosynthesis protein [Microbotryomycetes sp. JL221]
MVQCLSETIQNVSDFVDPNVQKTSSPMKRNPRKLKWTKAFRKAAGKEMTIDSTLNFEKRRHVPIKYDRDLVQTTIQGMKRIQQIKSKRELAFYKARMANAKPKSLATDSLEIEKSKHLLQLPAETMFNIQHTKENQRAINKAQQILENKKQIKLMRQQLNGNKKNQKVELQDDDDEEMIQDDDDEDQIEQDLSVMDALKQVDMGDMEIEPQLEDQIQIKVKSKGKNKKETSLRRTGGRGSQMMSMSLTK